jgi:hypothetical protein
MNGWKTLTISTYPEINGLIHRWGEYSEITIIVISKFNKISNRRLVNRM